MIRIPMIRIPMIRVRVIAILAGPVIRVVLLEGHQVGRLGDIEGRLLRMGRHCGIDGGLEVREVDRHVRLLEVEDLPWQQLQVVGLPARFGERRDGDAVPADLLHGIRQGVEGGDYVQPAIVGRGRGCRTTPEGQRRDGSDGGRPEHDNHSQLK